MDLHNLLNSDSAQHQSNASSMEESRSPKPLPILSNPSTFPFPKSNGEVEKYSFTSGQFPSPPYKLSYSSKEVEENTSWKKNGGKQYNVNSNPLSYGSTNRIPQSLDDRQEIRTFKPLQDVEAALRLLDRARTPEVRLEIETLDSRDFPFTDFTEEPKILNSNIYQTQSDWNQVWKFDQLEKMHSELYIKDQRNNRDLKRTIREFRQHAQNKEEVWYAKDIPIMHTAQCLSSKRNKNCMGCSSFWKSVQYIREDLQPWSENDLLHYEPEHSETFLGHIGMNGSFVPFRREMVACDTFNTLFNAEDPNSFILWGFIPPSEISRLVEEEIIGLQFFEQKTFIDPLFIDKKVRVYYGVQRPGQTVFIPSLWGYFSVRGGSGLSFSASWNYLRLRNILDARSCVEFNRSLGLYRPINISSLVISAGYQKFEELDSARNLQEKRSIYDFLGKTLPIIKTVVLEELLGEHLYVSALVILAYSSILEKSRKGGIRKMAIQPNATKEILQIRRHPLPTFETDVVDDDESHFYCSNCKYILFNSRRSCKHCKDFDLCENCYGILGKDHPHKMKRHFKTSIYSLIDLVDNIQAVVNDFENTSKEKEQRVEKERERRDREQRKELSVEKEINYNSNNPNKRKKRERDRPQPRRDIRELKPEKEKEKERDFDTTPEKEIENETVHTDEEVIDCICGNNKDLGFMISCEKCLAWLHGKCVGISKRNEPDEYYCPRCVKKQQVLNATGKLSPKDFSPKQKLKEYNLIS